MPPLSLSQNLPAVAAALVAGLALAGCGRSGAWQPIARPEHYEKRLPRSEGAALALEAHLEEVLAQPLAEGHLPPEEELFSPQARVRMASADAWHTLDGGPLCVETCTGADEELSPAQTLDRIAELLAPSAPPGFGELELKRFWLDEPRAVGRFLLHVGRSRHSTSVPPREGRIDLRLTFRAAFVRQEGEWRIERLELLEGTRLSGPGPRFVDVTAECGPHYGISEENRALLTDFTNRQQTLALGGLSVVDWNGDGFWDLLGTRRGQMALLFENDGLGGFIPRPLPMTAPSQCGSFLLALDLDGDGRRELVGSQPLGYAGEQAWCGIWRPSESGWELDSRALTFPNPIGLRRLSIQTIVPCDVDGNGRRDLFVAVYGSARSRGEEYNTVDARDGAANHLFIQAEDGSFRDETTERGIGGSRYTYVAHAFDFDFDGDPDLFEGNDFGPNILWRNDGLGRFVEDRELGLGGVPAYTMGLTMADLDGTGSWALYLSNMASAAGERIVPLAGNISEQMRGVVGQIAAGNQLYLYDRAEKRWRDEGALRGVNEAGWAWGCLFWDPDGDGDQDISVTNGFTSHSDPKAPDWESWYWRQVVADAAFLEQGRPSRDVNANAHRPSSFNGYERDRLFHRAADGSFHEAGWIYGLDAAHDGRCVAAVDVDGDGDADLVEWTLTGLRLYRNLSPPTPFVRLALRLADGHSIALGAEVGLHAPGGTQRRMVRVTEGFQTQVCDELQFALGDELPLPRTVAVEVRWPTGEVEEWPAVPVGLRSVLVQGQSEIRSAPLPHWPDEGGARPRTHPRLDLFVETAQGGSTTLEAPGKVVVVRVAEAAQPWAARDDLAERFPAVAWRAVRTGETGEARSDELRATPALLEAFFGDEPPDLPSTFIFDAQGSLRRALRRPTRPEEIAAWLTILEDEPPFAELLILEGRLALEDGRLRVAEAAFQRALESDPRRPDAFEGLGRIQMIRERPDLAAEAYARSVAIDPDYALGHYNLGVARVQLGQPAEALASFEESLRITGDRRPALMALAEAAYLARRPEIALDAWTRAAALDPADVESRLDRGKLLAQMGRLGEARAAFEEVLSLHPHHGEATRALARLEELGLRGAGKK